MGVRQKNDGTWEYWSPDWIIGDVNIYDYGCLYFEPWTKLTEYNISTVLKRAA